MSKILFITSRFLPNADANGICVANVITALQRKQHKVFCICERDKNQKFFEVIDGTYVYRIRPTLFSRTINYYHNNPKSIFRKVTYNFLRTSRKIIQIFLLPLFPDVSPYRTYLIYKLFKKIHRKECIDCIIGVYKPYEGIKTSIIAKKRYPDVTCIAYYLDLKRGALPPKPVPYSIYEKICYYSEKKEFKKLDQILLPNEGKKIYDIKRYDAFRDKIKYVDFPLYTTFNYNKNQKDIYDPNFINIVYAGTIDNDNRNPEYLLQILGIISQTDRNILFHFYGINRCREIIEQYKKLYPNLICEYGQVDYTYIQNCINSADFVVSITNKIHTNMVPSKIFQLFASKKPIINIINNKNDSTADYFKKYPVVINIKEYDNKKNEDISNLRKFLHEKKGFFVNDHSIDLLFKENMPNFTADIIESVINSRN